MKDEHIRRFVLSENTVVYGWIHKDNLLLWKRCLSAEVGQIDRKALIVNDIWDVMGVESDVVHLMSGLGDNYSQSGLDSSQLKFFFVYKHSENKNWVLLGREIRIPVSTKDKRQVVVG